MAGEKLQDLSKKVTSGRLSWTPKRDQTLYIIHTKPSYELYPEYGNRIVEEYFQPFEDRLDVHGREGLNFFFQDELKYDLSLSSWCEDMPTQFAKRKGYDIRKFLPALFDDMGDISVKTRLDYAEVLTQLAEERFFKPIFDWHSQRGLIYGCDNYGRGLEPTQYLDYFRATSWFTAPGNDAPARGSSFRSCKVSSSISHVYGRPRTWLEAFHSMGWSSNGEWLTQQLDKHIIAGGNLLCLHGLYYSTHGGWWEWAPPCFHFRMPYWPHLQYWLKYAERLCYLLSQGKHVCDIAVLYPTETLQAYPDADINGIWATTDTLSASGLDYDYIDYQSLQNAQIGADRTLQIGNEQYKFLILPDVMAMHQKTREKIEEFIHHGGKVITIGNPIVRHSTHIDNYADIITTVRSLQTPDFESKGSNARVLHRRIGDKDVYMVMGADNGDSLFFRAQGKCELWNAFDGSERSIPVLEQTTEGTWVRFSGHKTESRLYVFSPGQADLSPESTPVIQDSILLDDFWKASVVPTLDNRWGDYRLPASPEIIGPEAREFTSCFIPDSSLDTLFLHTSIYGYAPFMEEYLCLDHTDWQTTHIAETEWKPYLYSREYGVFDSPGSQGYHGLKCKVDHRVLILDQGCHQIYRTRFYVPRTSVYDCKVEGIRPAYISLDGEDFDDSRAMLTEGWHSLRLVYPNCKSVHYRLEDMVGDFVDRRERSMVYFEGTTFNPCGGNSGVWRYTFKTAPSSQSMRLHVAGVIDEVWVDGKQLDKEQIKVLGKGLYDICISANPSSSMQQITLTAHPDADSPGNAFFKEPVKFDCGEMNLPLDDWSKFGPLRFYSGGMNYSKEFFVPAVDANKLIRLSLGSVDATCEVKVNGQSAGILLSPPYDIDITPFIRKGDNRIEVLVYSSLSNHYATIPSPYRGQPHAGLIGPVRLYLMSL